MPRIERYPGAPAEDVVQPKPLPVMALDPSGASHTEPEKCADFGGQMMMQVAAKKSNAVATGDGAAIAEADAFQMRFLAMQGMPKAKTFDFATLDTKDTRLDDFKYGAAPTTYSKWGF